MRPVSLDEAGNGYQRLPTAMPMSEWSPVILCLSTIRFGCPHEANSTSPGSVSWSGVVEGGLRFSANTPGRGHLCPEPQQTVMKQTVMDVCRSLASSDRQLRRCPGRCPGCRQFIEVQKRRFMPLTWFQDCFHGKTRCHETSSVTVCCWTCRFGGPGRPTTRLRE